MAGALLAVHANRATDTWMEDFAGAQLRMLIVACASVARLMRANHDFA
jgi:hypothetical protein